MPINWKNRAKKMEQRLLAAEESTLAARKTAAHLDFALEKEKALHRRTCEEANALDVKLRRATMLLYGAAESLAGHGREASAEVLRMITDELYSIKRCDCAAGCAGAFAAKDEQH